jgi:hypothetical protein
MARAPHVKRSKEDEPYFVMDKWPPGLSLANKLDPTCNVYSMREIIGSDSKPRNRPGRPSLDTIDHMLIDAIRRAAQASGLKVSRLISVNVQVGLILGASREATLKRLQSKAKRGR